MDSQTLWAEVDLKAIANNVRELRRITNPDARLMAVVKANAYGHGAIEVSREALNNGADFLGVARINEGIRLRKAGINASILIFSFTRPALAKMLAEFDLTQTICSFKTAKALSDIAVLDNKKIKIHIKVDTGMGRLGILPDCFRTSLPGATGSALYEVESIARLPGLELEGIFTHFATADSSDKAFAKSQFAIFMDFLNRLRVSGIEIPIRHAANSAAIINLPEAHLDMVRTGIYVYGLYVAHDAAKRRISLKPAITLKSIIIHLKDVPAGFSVGYGGDCKTEKPTTIATVPVGYADGFNRMLSSRGRMLVCGHSAPIIGRVCMDSTVLDVGHIAKTAVGNEVVILGRQGKSSISADEIASNLNTISYEVISTVSDRIPRFYF